MEKCELQKGHPKGGNGKTEYEWVYYFRCLMF